MIMYLSAAVATLGICGAGMIASRDGGSARTLMVVFGLFTALTVFLAYHLQRRRRWAQIATVGVYALSLVSTAVDSVTGAGVGGGGLGVVVAALVISLLTVPDESRSYFHWPNATRAAQSSGPVR